VRGEKLESDIPLLVAAVPQLKEEYSKPPILQFASFKAN
jgi:hypothetical protein